MANANIFPPPLHEQQVVLSLSMEEARVMRTILRHIGGHDTYTMRKEADTISNALDRVGIPWYTPNCLEGRIYFNRGVFAFEGHD